MFKRTTPFSFSPSSTSTPNHCTLSEGTRQERVETTVSMLTNEAERIAPLRILQAHASLHHTPQIICTTCRNLSQPQREHIQQFVGVVSFRISKPNRCRAPAGVFVRKTARLGSMALDSAAFLGIDIGTTTAKVVVVDTRGQVVFQTSAATNATLSHTPPCHDEQSVATVVEGT